MGLADCDFVPNRRFPPVVAWSDLLCGIVWSACLAYAEVHEWRLQVKRTEFDPLPEVADRNNEKYT